MGTVANELLAMTLQEHEEIQERSVLIEESFRPSDYLDSQSY
jgi:hypothetical protein